MSDVEKMFRLTLAIIIITYCTNRELASLVWESDVEQLFVIYFASRITCSSFKLEIWQKVSQKNVGIVYYGVRNLRNPPYFY